MIEYELDYWQIKFIFQVRGSIIPKALCWAVPSTILGVLLHLYVVDRDRDMNMSQFGSYFFVLGFLVVFRCQQAYSRFWEAGTIIQRIRGNWFNSISGCFAFCSTDPGQELNVLRFKHTLIRLGSLLYCTSLQQVGVCEDERFEIIDLTGFSDESLQYLAGSNDKPLVVLQWMQQLIVRAHRESVLEVPAPILSRVYQELSNGIVGIVDAQKITDIVFPFPLAQLVSIMLIASSILSPVSLSIVTTNAVWCGVLNFITVFCFVGINFIASEIEMPFGDDPSDLPLHMLQKSLNLALIQLLDIDMATCPHFEVADIALECRTYPCPATLTDEDQHAMFKADDGEGARGASKCRFLRSRSNHNKALERKQRRLTVRGERQNAQVARCKERLSACCSSEQSDNNVASNASGADTGVSADRVRPVAHMSNKDSTNGYAQPLNSHEALANLDAKQRSDSLAMLPKLLHDHVKNDLEAKLLAHSAKMESQFSRISAILSDHVSCMVTDLEEALFARSSSLDLTTSGSGIVRGGADFVAVGKDLPELGDSVDEPHVASLNFSRAPSRRHIDEESGYSAAIQSPSGNHRLI